MIEAPVHDRETHLRRLKRARKVVSLHDPVNGYTHERVVLGWGLVVQVLSPACGDRCGRSQQGQEEELHNGGKGEAKEADKEQHSRPISVMLAEHHVTSRE